MANKEHSKMSEPEISFSPTTGCRQMRAYRLIALVYLGVALIFGAHYRHLQADTAAEQRWFVQTVDNDGNVGSWSSLALYHGQPHIAYTDDTLSALRYAYRDNSGWHTEVVDSWGYVGLLPSIGVDSNGRPHIAYFGTTEQKLKYAYKNDGTWTITPLAPAVSTYRFASLAMDAADYPHIAYVSHNWQLQYTYRDSAGWHTELVDAGSSSRVSLALDGNGRAHVSYVRGSSVRYAIRDAGQWQIQILPAPFSYGFDSTSLAVDSSGAPHLAFASGENLVDGTIYSVLRYARLIGGNWDIQLVAGGNGVAGDWGRDSSLALDKSDNPRISYRATGGPEPGLKYAYFDGASWQYESIGDDGLFTSLALDEAGNSYISYYRHASYRELRLAWSRPDYPHQVFLPFLASP
jgi:hypothetical protein